MNRKKYLVGRDVQRSDVPLNFLLGSSENDLSSFELAKLSAVANLRSKLHEVLDQLIDETCQAGLATWFRTTNREALKRALDNPDDAMAWAKERIRLQRQSKNESVPLPALNPGAAHRTASMTYQKRNVELGKCSACPQPLDRNSVRYCTKHLEIHRLRHKPKNAKGELPGTVGWLYGDTFESGHGKQPGSLAALARARKVNPTSGGKRGKLNKGSADGDGMVVAVRSNSRTKV